MISYRSYLKSRFGGRVLKVPVNAGFSCPNRDGAKSVSGCVFCDNRAFSPVHDNNLPPADQLRRGIDGCGGRYDFFLPYLQPFSNTYAPVDKLKSVYESLLSVDKRVIGLAVGTRPDCIDESVYGYLGDLNKRAYVSVELGLQSGHDSVLERMNRGHTVRDFTDAVYRLDGIDVETVAHIILGFPGETAEMAEQTAVMLSGLPVRGVKVHQLMVVEGTELARAFAAGELEEMTLEGYAGLLVRFIARLRPDQHIHRIMADSKPEYGLVAPAWSAKKTEAMNYLSAKIAKFC